MPAPEVWTTARLSMRPPRPEDAPVMFREWATDPEVTRYLTWRPHQDVSQTLQFIDQATDAWRGDTRRVWLITPIGAAEPIGLIELRLEPAAGSLGYLLARSAWGRGYMTEAVQGLVDIAVNKLGLKRVWAVCDVDNIASARVLEKAGLPRESRLSRHMRHPNISDQPRDVFLHALDAPPGT